MGGVEEGGGLGAVGRSASHATQNTRRPTSVPKRTTAIMTSLPVCDGNGRTSPLSMEYRRSRICAQSPVRQSSSRAVSRVAFSWTIECLSHMCKPSCIRSAFPAGSRSHLRKKSTRRLRYRIELVESTTSSRLFASASSEQSTLVVGQGSRHARDGHCSAPSVGGRSCQLAAGATCRSDRLGARDED